MTASQKGIRPNQSLLNPDLQRPNALDSIPRNPDALWLDKNENLDPILMGVSHKVLQDIPALALSTYPDSGELYRKLARWVGVDPQSLLLTPGSDGAIRLVFEAFVGHGDAVVHSDPTFAMYPVYGQMFGAKAYQIRYSPAETGPFLDPDEIIDMVRKQQPKLLCLPNPDSPTGSILEPDILRRILSVCEQTGTVFLLDEAYHPFHEWTAVAWAETSRNLVVARTFAKAWGAAGLRIGYAVAHPETIAFMHKMRPMYELGTIAVEFMSRMLEHSAEMANSVTRILEGKAFFAGEMEALGFKVLPTCGNFIHVAFGEKAGVVHAALSNKVLYRADFPQPCLAGYSRFTVAPRAVMEKVVQLIRQGVE